MFLINLNLVEYISRSPNNMFSEVVQNFLTLLKIFVGRILFDSRCFILVIFLSFWLSHVEGFAHSFDDKVIILVIIISNKNINFKYCNNHDRHIGSRAKANCLKNIYMYFFRVVKM